MKILFPKAFYVLLILLNISFITKGVDSLNFYVSLNYYRDLSDTYGVGGNIFSGEFTISKNWYGISISYGHYQSQSTFKFRILIEETNETFEIPIEEMAIMQIGSFSGFLRPVQNKWVDIDILFGAVYGKAESSSFKSFDYTYSLIERKITSLTRDYQLIKNNHFGYQAGINISFFPTKKIGMQINARMQDLSNGGTFFLVGGGICFKL